VKKKSAQYKVDGNRKVERIDKGTVTKDVDKSDYGAYLKKYRRYSKDMYDQRAHHIVFKREMEKSKIN